MKRFLGTILLTGLVVLLAEPVQIVLSNFLRIEQPATHAIQEGEWLSKLAQKYYGDVTFWKELALVNRAPNGNIVFPGEEIVIPSFAAIEEIRKSRSLSAVNSVMQNQEGILAGRVKNETVPTGMAHREEKRDESASQVKTDGHAGSSAGLASKAPPAPRPVRKPAKAATAEVAQPGFFTTPMLTGLAVLGVILVIGIVLFVRRRREQTEEEQYTPSDDSAEEEDPKSVYFFNDFKKQNTAGRPKEKEEAQV